MSFSGTYEVTFSKRTCNFQSNWSFELFIRTGFLILEFFNKKPLNSSLSKRINSFVAIYKVSHHNGTSHDFMVTVGAQSPVADLGNTLDKELMLCL